MVKLNRLIESKSAQALTVAGAAARADRGAPKFRGARGAVQTDSSFKF